jgi:hypothetical protein
LSPEHLGFVQNKGFDKDPNSIIHSYKHLEGLVGQKERVVLLPDDKDPKSYDDFYNKIGRPEKPEGYGIQADEKGDPKFAEFAAKMFHEAGMSKKQAEKVIGKWGEFSAQHQQEAERVSQEKAVASQASLKKEWGGAYEQNINIAKAAAQKFGLTPETVAALEKSTDYATVFKFLTAVGMKTGEGNFVDGKSATGFLTLTPGQAQERKNRLSADPEWIKRYVGGGTDERAEMDRLNKAILGE